MKAGVHEQDGKHCYKRKDNASRVTHTMVLEFESGILRSLRDSKA